MLIDSSYTLVYISVSFVRLDDNPSSHGLGVLLRWLKANFDLGRSPKRTSRC